MRAWDTEKVGEKLEKSRGEAKSIPVLWGDSRSLRESEKEEDRGRCQVSKELFGSSVPKDLLKHKGRT